MPEVACILIMVRDCQGTLAFNFSLWSWNSAHFLRSTHSLFPSSLLSLRPFNHFSFPPSLLPWEVKSSPCLLPHFDSLMWHYLFPLWRTPSRALIPPLCNKGIWTFFIKVQFSKMQPSVWLGVLNVTLLWWENRCWANNCTDGFGCLLNV